MSPAATAAREGFSLSRTLPVMLLQAAHPRQAVGTALALGVAAALTGRPLREVGLVAGTVLVGQTMLGWDNDLVDRDRDARHEREGKPIARGWLEPGTVWVAMTCALLLVVPLSLASGPRAGGAYLVSVLIGLLGNRFLRGSWLSFLPWVLGFGLYPFFLAYGGWDGVGTTTGPSVPMVALAALLGLGVHLLRSLPGLVQDNQDGLRSLPLRIALRTGATKLLIISGVLTAVIVIAILITGRASGLS